MIAPPESLDERVCIACSSPVADPRDHADWCSRRDVPKPAVEPTPWTDAHRREAFVRLCEIAIERRQQRTMRVPCVLLNAAANEDASESESAFRSALATVVRGGFDIEREVAIVRERAERAASPPRSRADLLTLIRAARAGALRPAEMAEFLSRLEWIFASEEAPREPPRALIADLHDVATGKIEHVYGGTCPETGISGDQSTADDRADPLDECPACEVLRRADAALSSAPQPVGPTTPEPSRIRPCVAALVTDTAGRLLLVRTKRGWEIPGGGLEVGETWREGIARELREETGLDVILDPGEPRVFDGMPVNGAQYQSIIVIARGTVSGDAAPRPADGDDVGEARWFAAGEVPMDGLSNIATAAVVREWVEAALAPRWTPPPGVSVEVLHGDPAGPLLVVKVTLDAGAEVPREEHEEQTETILTVSGEVIVTSAWPDHDGFGCMTIPARVSHVVRNASTTEPATYLAILRRVEREPVGDTEPAPAPAATAVEAGSRSLRVFYGIASGCHSDSDGDCAWVNCPQARDGEPQKTGRHCPLDVREEA